MARKSYDVIMLVNEEHPETGTKYMTTKSNKGMKTNEKLRLRKYDPVLRNHCWFIQKKLPNPKAN